MPREKVNRWILTGIAVMVLSLACAVATQAAAQAGPTTYGDLLSPEELAKIQLVIIDGPPTPPPGFVRPLAPRQGAFKALTTASLSVPTSTWTYGCTATSAGMIFAYYDRNGYPNMYTGPCNGGVCPTTNVGQGDIPGSPIPGACSIIATENGFDGRVIRGHVEDYWISYLSPGPDPWEGQLDRAHMGRLYRGLPGNQPVEMGLQS